MTQGIKISKPTKDIKTAALKDLLFHSDYSMFKYHMDTTASMTINAGDSTKTVTVAHNLGYVPAFMVYGGDSSGIIPLPYRLETIGGIDRHTYAYADSTNIYIVWKSSQPYNQSTGTGLYFYDNLRGYNEALAGNVLGAGYKCSMVFGSILSKNDSIKDATLNFHVGAKGTGTGDVKIKTWGIDVDEIDGYDTFSSSKTTASVAQNVATPEGETFGINVKSIVEEITTRSGFVNYSSLGFYIEDNGSPYDANIWDWDYGSTLTITRSGTLTNNFRVIVFKDKIHS
jgi:hypothetical protein